MRSARQGERGLPSSPSQNDTSEESDENEPLLFDTLVLEDEYIELDPAFAKESDALAKVVMDRFSTWLASSSSKRLGPDSSSSHKQIRNRSLLEHIAVGQQTPPGEDDTVIVELPWLDPPVYACLFYVEDPVQNIPCLIRTNLHTIEALKHHLWNSHRQSPFCPTCGTEFLRFDERDDHPESNVHSEASSDTSRPVG